MPAKDVKKMAQALHDAGALSLDTKLSDLLKIEGVGDVDPTTTVASSVVAWDGYVLVTAANLREDLGRKEIQNPRP